MDFDFSLFLRALGLAFVIEGIVWAIFPNGMRRAMASLLESGEAQIRGMGLFILVLGTTLAWLASR